MLSSHVSDDCRAIRGSGPAHPLRRSSKSTALTTQPSIVQRSAASRSVSFFKDTFPASVTVGRRRGWLRPVGPAPPARPRNRPSQRPPLQLRCLRTPRPARPGSYPVHCGTMLLTERRAGFAMRLLLNDVLALSLHLRHRSLFNVGQGRPSPALARKIVAAMPAGAFRTHGLPRWRSHHRCMRD